MKELDYKEKELKKILEDIKDYVIVTGSYAENKQTSQSDIDFYVKLVPEELVNLEANYVEDNYCAKLIRYFKNKNYKIGSVFVDSFHIDDTCIPLEFSSYYNVNESDTFEIEILGVKLKAAKSLYCKST